MAFCCVFSLNPKQVTPDVCGVHLCSVTAIRASTFAKCKSRSPSQNKHIQDAKLDTETQKQIFYFQNKKQLCVNGRSYLTAPHQQEQQLTLFTHRSKNEKFPKINMKETWWSIYEAASWFLSFCNSRRDPQWKGCYFYSVVTVNARGQLWIPANSDKMSFFGQISV